MKTSKIVLMITLLVLVFLFLFLTAANPWKARLRIINLTGDEIFLVLSDDTGIVYSNLRIPGQPTPPPTPTPDPDYKPTPGVTPQPTATPFDLYQFRSNNTTMFTIERKVYYARLVACGVVMEGTMDMTTNLHLTITDCFRMVRYDNPQYLGEPTFEKPNFFRAPGMGNWRFRYFLPKVNMDKYPFEPNLLPPLE
jgi:hypothetical protein